MRLLQSGLRIYPVILYIGMENNSRIYLTLVLKRKIWGDDAVKSNSIWCEKPEVYLG